jgi:hypothetical protein
MAQRVSAKVRIAVVAVGLSDANVSRETAKKFRRTKREQFSKVAKAEEFGEGGTSLIFRDSARRVSSSSLNALHRGQNSIHS